MEPMTMIVLVFGCAILGALCDAYDQAYETGLVEGD